MPQSSHPDLWWHTSDKWWEKLKPLARENRQQPTPAENALWQRLRKRQIANVKFRRQYAIGPFIVDFFAKEASLIIEVDGPIHDYTTAEDALRTEYLESLGFRVVRFRNQDVLTNISHVLNEICSYVSP